MQIHYHVPTSPNSLSTTEGHENTQDCNVVRLPPISQILPHRSIDDQMMTGMASMSVDAGPALLPPLRDVVPTSNSLEHLQHVAGHIEPRRGSASGSTAYPTPCSSPVNSQPRSLPIRRTRTRKMRTGSPYSSTDDSNSEVARGKRPVTKKAGVEKVARAQQTGALGSLQHMLLLVNPDLRKQWTGLKSNNIRNIEKALTVKKFEAIVTSRDMIEDLNEILETAIRSAIDRGDHEQAQYLTSRRGQAGSRS